MCMCIYIYTHTYIYIYICCFVRGRPSDPFSDSFVASFCDLHTANLSTNIITGLRPAAQ